MKKIYIYIVLLLVALVQLMAGAVSPGGKYVLRHITAKTGLPQDTVRAVAQDRNGFTWIGTDAGLVRFDGVRFRYFNKNNTNQLKSNSITAIHPDHQGTLWIGTHGGGITLLRKGVFEAFTTQNGLPNDFIQTITQDNENTIWLGTVGSGVIRYKNNQFKALTIADGLSHDVVNAICRDHRGNLWFGTDNGLNRFKDSTFKTYTTTDGLADNKITSLLLDSRGLLWVGTPNGLTTIKTHPGSTYTTRHGLEDNHIHAIHEDTGHNLWFATGSGLALLPAAHRSGRDITGEKPFTSGPITGHALRGIYQDREKNLWIGSPSRGLYILHPKRLQSYTIKNNLSHNHIHTVARDNSGNTWIGTDGGGLNILNEKTGSVTVYTTRDGLAGDFVYSILTGPGNRTWIGTGNGLSLFDGKTFQNYTRRDGLSSDSIRALYLDHTGHALWIGTYGGGLNRLDIENKTIRPYTQKDGLSNNYILSITQDKENNTWIGTLRGLNRFDGNTFRVLTRKQGLSGETINDILPGDDGVLWIAFNDGGLNLYNYHSGTITHFDSRHGLISDTIYKLIHDHQGSLWLSSGKGIFSLSVSELYQVARGSRDFLSILYFDEGDGMPTAVCSGGSQSAGVRGRDGRLWFPTVDGLVVIDPKARQNNSFEPPVFIENLVIDGLTRRPRPMIKLPTDTRLIKIAFTAPSFTAPRKVRFRYRLLGHKDKWIETHSREPIEYSYLPPGKYTFELTACNSDGAWSSSKSTLYITITAPFYQSFWFYLIIAFLLTGVGFWFYWLPEYRRRQAEKDEKYQASTLTVPRLRRHARKLLKLMEQEKPYLDADLTAEMLAEMLGVSRKSLSQVINQEFHVNFKNFVNKYRIEEAQRKLTDPREQDFVLLKIAMDCGFNSKSVFNDAFKKFTGMSPSQYRKNNGNVLK